MVDRQEMGWLTCTIGGITFLWDFKFDHNNDLFLPRFIYGSCLLLGQEALQICCVFSMKNARFYVTVFFNALVISTFPAGEKPHQIKSKSLINALFVLKILK